MKQFLSAILNSGTPKQRKQKTFAVTAIAITAALIVIALVTLCALAIADAVTAPAPAPEGEGSGNTGVARDLVTTTFDEGQLYKGNLIVTNDTYVMQDTPTLELLNDKRPRNEAGSPLYTILGWTTLSVTPDTSEAFHKMYNDFHTENATAAENLIVAVAATESAPELYKNGQTLSLEYYISYTSSTEYEKASIANADAYAWIRNNAYKYGFLLATKPTATADNTVAPYVLRYVGLEHAALAEDVDCETLEDYLTYLRDNTSPAKTKSISVSVTGADGKTSKVSYKIFYQAHADGATYYTADPSKYTATVSGDNMSGYIVSYCAISK